jgi:hypothetical protein
LNLSWRRNIGGARVVVDLAATSLGDAAQPVIQSGSMRPSSMNRSTFLHGQPEGFDRTPPESQADWMLMTVVIIKSLRQSSHMPRASRAGSKPVGQ